MSYPAMAIANAFIHKALLGQVHHLTPMKLQKLMFFAQSWYVKLYKEVLFDGIFERWQYGPVLAELYYEFRDFGKQDITRLGTDVWGKEAVLSESEERTAAVLEFLDKILQTYGTYSGPQLSWMTHQAGTAWSMGEMGSFIRFQELYEGKV